MSSFLDSLGWSLFPFFLGLGFFSFSKRLEKDNKIILSIISALLIAIGCFYLAYTLISIRDFTNGQYYSMLAFISMISTFLMVQMHKAIRTTERKLLNIIAALSRFIVFKGKEIAGPEKEEEYIKNYRIALKKGRENE